MHQNSRPKPVRTRGKHAYSPAYKRLQQDITTAVAAWAHASNVPTLTRVRTQSAMGILLSLAESGADEIAEVLPMELLSQITHSDRPLDAAQLLADLGRMIHRTASIGRVGVQAYLSVHRNPT